MTPEVHIVKSEIRFMDGARIPWANRVTNLANNEEYRHTVALLAATYAARGHKVLVVSDRVHFYEAAPNWLERMQFVLRARFHMNKGKNS